MGLVSQYIDQKSLPELNHHTVRFGYEVMLQSKGKERLFVCRVHEQLE